MIILKGKEDLEIMRQAGRIVAEVLERLTRAVKPGITTASLDMLAETLLKNRGARAAFKGYRGFPASICSSVNEEVVHGIPGSRYLNEGDIVSIDLGAIWQGFVGDAAVTIPVGEVEPEVQRLLKVTEESLYQGIDQAQPGNRLGQVSNAIQRHAESNGFSVVRKYVGHGIGRQMHEDPPVPNYGSKSHGPRLQEGMVLAIEPMINVGGYDVVVQPDNWTVVTRDGSYSAHFEHTVAITEQGPAILTRL